MEAVWLVVTTGPMSKKGARMEVAALAGPLYSRLKIMTGFGRGFSYMFMEYDDGVIRNYFFFGDER